VRFLFPRSLPPISPVGKRPHLTAKEEEVLPPASNPIPPRAARQPGRRRRRGRKSWRGRRRGSLSREDVSIRPSRMEKVHFPTSSLQKGASISENEFLFICFVFGFSSNLEGKGRRERERKLVLHSTRVVAYRERGGGGEVEGEIPLRGEKQEREMFGQTAAKMVNNAFSTTRRTTLANALSVLEVQKGPIVFVGQTWDLSVPFPACLSLPSLSLSKINDSQPLSFIFEPLRRSMQVLREEVQNLFHLRWT